MSLKRKAAVPPTGDASKKPKKNADLTSFFGAPKITPSNPSSTTSSPNSSPTIKFDKQKWLAGLNSEQKSLLQLEIDTLDESWLAVLKDEILSREFLDLKRYLQKEVATQKIYPPMDLVYSWSRHCPLHKVRAVILGQDPYHGPNQAHGLCFSVLPPTPAPPSLANIYKAIAVDYPSFRPPPGRSGLLTPWADQGVLLLNTCLTVRAGQANSHNSRGWEKFTQKVIDIVVKTRTQGVVFLAWGSPAQKRCSGISGARHLVLKSVHPSPLAAHKPPGFFNNGHFIKCNEFLEQRYGEGAGINWDLNVPKPVAAVKGDGGPGEDKGETGKGKGINGHNKDKTHENSEQSDKTAAVVSTVPKKQDVNKVSPTEEFEGVDDDDAIEALEELARLEEQGKLKDGGNQK
ncbi:hypothetical protein B0A52_05706 [Exophiala mesophila]|uniref:Uracil-DNA glycosylase n=1 Tax=Exophiala mesophila TaxID=212818 RepID=A0A438N2B5_EXOME|nr:hypothetical protein B0A52_05706 [Exophiala mesophila]